MSSSEYLGALADSIKDTHGCSAKHVKTHWVDETHNGQTIWSGAVEQFKVDHDKAKRCYAWGFREGKEESLTCVCVLAVAPVESPITAVRAYLASIGKDRGGT